MIDMTGKTVANWQIVSRAENNKHGQAMWNCICTGCNTPHTVAGFNIRSGDSKQCNSCQRKKIPRSRYIKHGMTNSPEWLSWNAMHQRCYCPNHVHYKNYGGRGVIVCYRWRSKKHGGGEHGFENFLKDLGPRPKGCNLSRINDSLIYEKGKVSWLSSRENSRDTRAQKLNMKDADEIRRLYATGDFLQSDLARQFGVNQQQISRIVNGQRWF